MAAPSVLTLEERTGAKRKLELYGAALPFQSAKWSGLQKLVTTWNPGNRDNATQHVLGPQLLPSEWEGLWNTTRMVASPSLYYPDGGSAQRVTRASTLADILDDFREVGSLLVVTWSADDGRRKVREGRIEQLDLSYIRFDDIHWTLRWAWTGTGNSVQKVVTFKQDNNDAVQQQIASALNELVSVVDGASSDALQINKGILNSASSLSLGDLESMADGVTNLAKQIGSVGTQIGSRVSQLGDLINKVGTLPANIVSQMKDVAATMSQDFAHFSDQIGRIAPETQAAFGSDSRPSVVMRSVKHFGQVQQAAEKASAKAMDLALIAARTKSSFIQTSTRDRARSKDMLAVHLSKQGDTFASVSKRYYGTADLADRIAKANGFPLYQVAPPLGRPLIIPNRSAFEDIKKA